MNTFRRVTLPGDDLQSVPLAAVNILATSVDVFVPQPKLLKTPSPGKLHGFAVEVEKLHEDDGSCSWDYDLFHASRTNNPGSDQILILDEGTSGTAGIVVFRDTRVKVDFIRVGFNEDFFPIVQVHERAVNEATPATEDNDWLIEDIQNHPGSVKVYPYLVVHERGSWYFGMPYRTLQEKTIEHMKLTCKVSGEIFGIDFSETKLDMSKISLNDDNDDDDWGKGELTLYPRNESAFLFPGVPIVTLNFQIKKLDILICLAREVVHGHLLWKLSVSKYKKDCKVPFQYRTFHPGKKDMSDEQPYDIVSCRNGWHRSPDFDRRYDRRRDWGEISTREDYRSRNLGRYRRSRYRRRRGTYSASRSETSYFDENPTDSEKSASPDNLVYSSRGGSEIDHATTLVDRVSRRSRHRAAQGRSWDIGGLFSGYAMPIEPLDFGIVPYDATNTGTDHEDDVATGGQMDQHHNRSPTRELDHDESSKQIIIAGSHTGSQSNEEHQKGTWIADEHGQIWLPGEDPYRSYFQPYFDEYGAPYRGNLDSPVGANYYGYPPPPPGPVTNASTFSDAE